VTAKTRIGGSDRGRFGAENDSGGGPATSASHTSSAPEIDSEILGGTSEDLFSAAVLEIEREFRARLKGLRRLPYRERGLALRLAREWRRDAMQALKERRAKERPRRARSARQWQSASLPHGTPG
jgi:hypothetical protein